MKNGMCVYILWLCACMCMCVCAWQMVAHICLIALAAKGLRDMLIVYVQYAEHWKRVLKRRKWKSSPPFLLKCDQEYEHYFIVLSIWNLLHWAQAFHHSTLCTNTPTHTLEPTSQSPILNLILISAIYAEGTYSKENSLLHIIGSVSPMEVLAYGKRKLFLLSISVDRVLVGIRRYIANWIVLDSKLFCTLLSTEGMHQLAYS